MNTFTSCLICHHPDLVKMAEYERDYLCRCGKCGFVFSERIPTMEELVANYSNYPRSNKISEITLKRYDELLAYFERFRKTNNMIDVGAGDGYFIQRAKEKGWNAYATEFDDISVELCRQKGITTHKGKLEAKNYEAGMMDVIYSSEVIEHINNPVEEVRNFNAILRSGGVVYVTTPNFNSVSRKVLKSGWRIIEYPEHLCYYSSRTLGKLFKDNGFLIEQIKTTGITPSIFFKQKTNAVHSHVSTEEIREKTETKPLWNFIKNTLNAMLNTTKTGDTLKGKFVKK